MRAIIVAAGASLFTLGSLVWPSTAVADYEVCNKTDTDVYVAYGFINPAGGGWATKLKVGAESMQTANANSW